jgi:hypothetical protein
MGAAIIRLCVERLIEQHDYYVRRSSSVPWTLCSFRLAYGEGVTFYGTTDESRLG